jgi:hypothetical protein
MRVIDGKAAFVKLKHSLVRGRGRVRGKVSMRLHRSLWPLAGDRQE